MRKTPSFKFNSALAIYPQFCCSNKYHRNRKSDNTNLIRLLLYGWQIIFHNKPNNAFCTKKTMIRRTQGLFCYACKKFQNFQMILLNFHDSWEPLALETVLHQLYYIERKLSLKIHGRWKDSTKTSEPLKLSGQLLLCINFVTTVFPSSQKKTLASFPR